MAIAGTQICADGVRRPIEELDGHQDAEPHRRYRMSVAGQPAPGQVPVPRDGGGWAWSDFVVGDTAPDDPADGLLWIDTSAPDPVAKQHDTDTWVTLVAPA